MKKIISALTLGAMVAGTAFADVSINLNFRQRANLFTKYDANPAVKTDKSRTYAFFTDAYSGSGSDNLAMSLSGDIVSFDMQWVTDAATTNAWRAKGLNASVFLGPVTVFGGLWADGKLNGAYRTKADIDAGNLEGMDFEYKKLGSAFAKSPANFIDNMMCTVTAGLENYGIGAAYKVPGIDNGALTLNAVYLSNETSSTVNKATKPKTTLTGHTGVFLADGRIDGIGQGEVVVKYGEFGKNEDGDMQNALAFGVVAQPTIVKNLISTVAFAGDMIDGDFNDYSVDLRLRYQAIPKKLSITSFHNYSALVDGKKSAKKLVPTTKDGVTTDLALSAKGIANAWGANKGGAESSGKLGGSQINRDQILSNNLMVRYNVNDKFSVYGIVADMIGMGSYLGNDLADKDSKKTTDPIIQLRCSAWTQFYADKNNSVAIGFVYALNDVTDTYGSKYATMGVPVIFRVKM